MTRLAVGALALLLVLAGCGGDPTADPAPTKSPSASTATTPVSSTPTPPVMPEKAKADTKAGAIAFVQHYVELINFAQATGKLDELAASESNGCGSCRSGRKVLAEIYRGGGHILGGDLHIKVADALPNPTIAGWIVEGSLAYGPQTVVRPSATPSTQELKGGSSLVSLQVSYRSGRWTVIEWTRAQ